jgi:hypothetical protein
MKSGADTEFLVEICTNVWHKLFMQSHWLDLLIAVAASIIAFLLVELWRKLANGGNTPDTSSHLFLFVLVFCLVFWAIYKKAAIDEGARQQQALPKDSSPVNPDEYGATAQSDLNGVGPKSKNSSNPAASRPLQQPITAVPTQPDPSTQAIVPKADPVEVVAKQAPPPVNSGVLHYHGPPVPYNGVVVFENLPKPRLKFNFDRSLWVLLIKLNPDGTKNVKMTSLKRGYQTSCDLGWEILN